MALEDLTQSNLTEQLNTKFRFSPGDSNVVEVELVEVTEYDYSPGNEQFSVVFRGPLDIFLTQGIYNAEHEKLGTFIIFLVPIKRDNEGFYYEAAFNRFSR
jgi:hypothetical protein